MDKLQSYLIEWLVRYIKNRDLILGQIKGVDEQENRVLVKYEDKEQIYIVEPFLNDLSKIIEFKEYEFITVVVYNTRENFDFVCENWDKLANFKKHFNIIFVNPFSNLDKKWSIYPCTHNMISERASLKKGLETLYNNVEEISKEKLRKIIES